MPMLHCNGKTAPFMIAHYVLNWQKEDVSALVYSPRKAICCSSMIGTAILGLSSGESITPEEVAFALENRGYLVSSSIEPYDMRSQYGPLVCRVTFAYVDDCRDAVKVHIACSIMPRSIANLSSLGFPKE